MAYGNNFAGIYDMLMYEDINYPKWADYIENLFDHYDCSPDLVCDLACGTGNFTIELARRGYDMTGVDYSADMLDKAREKGGKQDILFLNQNLSQLDLYGSMGAFLCMIDGFNYILSPKVLLGIFSRIHSCFLDYGGLLIFDISSKHKLKNIIGNNIFLHSGKDVFYAWDNRFHENVDISEMNLTFFKKSGKGYRRFYENHLQRAYSEKEILYLLKKAGFSHTDTFEPLTFSPPEENSERIVFAAKY